MPEAHDHPLDQSNRSCRRYAPTPWLLLEERYSDDGTLQLRLEGELDLASREPVSERLRELQQAGTPALLDLSGITFIDCSGLRVILQALETDRGDGAGFELSPEPSAPFRRLLELTRDMLGRSRQ